MILPTDRLDPTSLAYLQRVEQTRGESGTGAFIRMGAGASRGAIAFWLIVLGLAALGLAALGVVVAVGWPSSDMETDFTVRSFWQTGLAAAGVLFLGIAIVRIARGKPKSVLGSFRYFDALHMWAVWPGRVEAVPLESLTEIDGTLHSGSANFARIVLNFRTDLAASAGAEEKTTDDRVRPLTNGRREFVIRNPDRSKVEYLVRFVHTMILLRNSEDAGLRALAQGAPALTAAMAARLARGENIGDLSKTAAGDDPPRPFQAAPPETNPTFARRVAPFLPWVAAAAVGAAVFFLAQPLDRRFLDEYYFGRVPATDSGFFTDLDAYLAKFPDGRHAQDVRDLRDDRLFARVPAQGPGDIAAIDAYLNELPRGRHADEARRLRDDRLFARIPPNDGGFAEIDDYLGQYANGRHADEARLLRDDHDDRLFALVPAQGPGDIPAIDAYVKQLPRGRHADEARLLRDDRLFARIPPGDGGFAEIDDYLGHYANGRHADEARLLRDDRLFARIPPPGPGDVEAIDEYLKQYADGRHTKEARVLRDERLFTRGDQATKDRHSLSSLRQYLDDRSNVRHRDEAQKRIDAIYDEAIARLKKQAKENTVDESMFEAVLALLEALKKTNDPFVTVGFHATQDLEPTTEDQKAFEKLVYAARLEKNPELKGIADHSPGKTAILPVGETFTDVNTKLREDLIVDALRKSVENGLDADVISFLPDLAPGLGPPPVMTVTYHVHPDGGLYLYTTTSHDDLLGEQKKVNGLLRGYTIDWTIAVKPPGVADKKYEFKVQSKPATNLKYDSEPDDPAWAPYAVILYSGFDDMSRKLVQDFGVKPPAAKDSYRFSESIFRLLP